MDLEITFCDGTKITYLDEVWDEFKFMDNGYVEIRKDDIGFAWYNLDQIKSMITIPEVEA